MKELLGAIWTFVGIVIGAGIFGLPYVFYKAGFFTGLVVLIFVGIIVTLITLYLGEIVLRTKGKHQLTGLAGIYLGKKGKVVMFIANVLSIYGALAAYIIGGGAAIAAIVGGNNLLFYLLFFIFVAPFLYFSIKVVEGFESFFTPLKIFVVLILGFLLFGFVDFKNIVGFHLQNIFIPYGVAVFAFSGFSAVPEINEELKNKKYMLWAIVLGMIISFIVQLIFIFSVVGSMGTVNEIATTSLSEFGFGINLISNLFAILTMATAFVALGFALKENFTLDLKIPNLYSWLLVILLPLALVLTGFFGFAKLLELTGAAAVGVILSLIIIMHSKARKLGNRKPEYSLADNLFLKVFLFLILITGIVYSIIGGF